MPTSKFKIIPLDIYNTKVYLIKASRRNAMKEIGEVFGEMPDDIMPDCYGGFMVLGKDGVATPVIWVIEWKALAHEIFHCVDFILRDIGVSLNEGSDEAYAYLIGYLDNKLRGQK